MIDMHFSYLIILICAPELRLLMGILDPRQRRKGPMNSALSMRPSVRNAVFSEWAH